MSTTANLPAARGWVHLHRAALVIVVLCMALAATLGLLAARAFTGSTPVPASSVTIGHVPPVDNQCQLQRPGRPVPC